jgi:hypothetical protein
MLLFIVATIVAYFCAFFIALAFEIPVGILEKWMIDSISLKKKNHDDKSNKETAAVIAISSIRQSGDNDRLLTTTHQHHNNGVN